MGLIAGGCDEVSLRINDFPKKRPSLSVSSPNAPSARNEQSVEAPLAVLLVPGKELDRSSRRNKASGNDPRRSSTYGFQ